MGFLLEAAKSVGDRISEGPTLSFFVLVLTLIVGPLVAEKIRLPAMVGLVLAGMAVGPNGFKVLDPDTIALPALGILGLLYLMFSAGLELDLKLFARTKRIALSFAVLSFLVPFVLGLVSARYLGYEWAGAMLMGSNWGSHTLVTYPLLRQKGLSRNRAVGTVVGATAVTDTAALLVLTGVTASVKRSGDIGLQALGVVTGLALLAAWTLVALPRLAHWFFAAVGTESPYRFLFGLAALLSGALLAQAAQIDGIVGAFFAGLGLIRAVPERSALMERVQFVGAALLIPIFLVSVGILLEPKVLAHPKTIEVALIFTVAALGGKALAAVITGRIFRFEWSEIGVMSGLSGSQAAATLAITLVGARLGIFGKQTINAVLVVILFSLIATPAMVSYFAKKVSPKTDHAEAVGNTVLVPVWGESTRPLLAVAGLLASTDGGIVLATSIALEEAPDAELASQRRLQTKAEEWLAKDGLEGRTLFRVSRSVEEGILETLRGESATLVLAEWEHPKSAEIGGRDHESRWRRAFPVPVVLTHGAVDRFDRIVVLGRPGRTDSTSDLGVAAELSTRLVHDHQGPHGHQLVYVGTDGMRTGWFFSLRVHMDSIQNPDPIGWARSNTGERDLIVVAGLALMREVLDRIPGFAERTFFVVIGAKKQDLGTGSGGPTRWRVPPVFSGR